MNLLEVCLRNPTLYVLSSLHQVWNLGQRTSGVRDRDHSSTGDEAVQEEEEEEEGRLGARAEVQMVTALHQNGRRALTVCKYSTHQNHMEDRYNHLNNRARRLLACILTRISCLSLRPPT